MATVAVSACSAQDVPDAAAPTASTAAAAATPPAVSLSPTAAQPTVAPPTAFTPPSQPGPSASPSRPTDVTQDAATRYVAPAPEGGPIASALAVARGVSYADPLAVATGYVTRRLTYRYDDPVGYRAALTAPAFTTPAFATRSAPSGAALAQVKTAQETSAVQISAAQLESEAPNTATTQYVSVTCRTTTSYRGGGGNAPATWTLRLVQAPPGQWRVDGVLSTD